MGVGSGEKDTWGEAGKRCWSREHNHLPFGHCKGQEPSQGSWHSGILTLGPACMPSGQALWVGGIVPIGNGLDIINPANHQPQPSRRGGYSPEQWLPEEAPSPYFPSSNWVLGHAKLCSCLG